MGKKSKQERRGGTGGKKSPGGSSNNASELLVSTSARGIGETLTDTPDAIRGSDAAAAEEAAKQNGNGKFDLWNPQPRPDCDICMITLPIKPNLCMYLSCCGKMICCGCHFGHQRQCDKDKTEQTCPFCREPMSEPDSAVVQRMKKRAEMGDADAIRNLSGAYRDATLGLQEDEAKALKLLQRAADLGNPTAQHQLAVAYLDGDFGLVRNTAKATSYWEMAAAGGHVMSRYNLGCQEDKRGVPYLAMIHWRIAAEAGSKKAVDRLTEYFVKHPDMLTKPQLEKIMRAKHEACEAMRSDERDEVVKIKKGWGDYGDEP